MKQGKYTAVSCDELFINFFESVLVAKPTVAYSDVVNEDEHMLLGMNNNIANKEKGL